MHLYICVYFYIYMQVRSVSEIEIQNKKLTAAVNHLQSRYSYIYACLYTYIYIYMYRDRNTYGCVHVWIAFVVYTCVSAFVVCSKCVYACLYLFIYVCRLNEVTKSLSETKSELSIS